MIASPCFCQVPSWSLLVTDPGRHTSGAHVYGASRYVLDTRGLMLTGCRIQSSGLRHAHWPVGQQNDHPSMPCAT